MANNFKESPDRAGPKAIQKISHLKSQFKDKCQQAKGKYLIRMKGKE